MVFFVSFSLNMSSFCHLIVIYVLVSLIVRIGGLPNNETGAEGLERKAGILKKQIELLHDVGNGKVGIFLLVTDHFGRSPRD